MQTFFLSVFLLFLFDKSTINFQFIEIFYFNFHEIVFGIDGISIFLILLTTFLIPLCILSNWNNTFYFKEFAICFLLIEAFLILIFTILDLLLFYVFFESILIPMFLIIGLWGSGRRKVRSGFFFFFYTLLGSVLMLLSIIFIFKSTGSLNYLILINYNFSFEIQKYLWIGFMLAFMSKVPMIPFHIWLPEAHVEAPTSGSVLLAGILLKLGTYGILRFLIPLFPLANIYFTPIVYSFAGFSIIYASATALRQADLKRIIAYTSIAHMNLVVIALFVVNHIGFTGALFQMLAHGIVSSALFFCIGFYYDRFHTRIIDNFGGTMQTLPLLSVCFLIFNLANLGMPTTCNFVGEFLMLSGIYIKNNFICFISALGMVFSGAYSLWVCNRVCFGNLKMVFVNDLNRREFFILFILIVLTFIFGIFSTIITDYTQFSFYYLINIINNKTIF
jgi:proton-translocating NADH-quinone oxidoreductase chain M